MKFKTKKLVILLSIGLIFHLILSSDFSSTDILEADVDIPKQSGGYTEPFIHIDASNPNNWTWTAGNYSWCYFDNGYYIIENVTIDATVNDFDVQENISITGAFNVTATGGITISAASITAGSVSFTNFPASTSTLSATFQECFALQNAVPL